MSQQSGSAPSARDQALTLIDYLLAFEAFRHPPVRRVADHQLFRLAASALPDHPAVQVHPDDERWLVVDFIDLPTAPVVPTRVVELLTDPTVGPDVEPQIVPARPVAEGDAEGDEAAVVAEWTRRTDPARDWIERVWRPFAAEHQVAVSVKELHRALFEQREILAVDRETYELVWGFGHLTWTDRSRQDTVDHPVLTVPVEIDIDRRTQRATVRPAGGIEVESRMLNGLDLHDRSGYAAARQEVTDADLDPWVPDEVDELYRRLVRAVDDHGTALVGPDVGPGPVAHATVTPTWTLFQRRRLPDSEGFLLQMRELYRELPDVIPPPLRAMLTSEDPTAAEIAPAAGEDRTGGDDGILLLPLPANEQQERILRTSRRQAGVVVQGPPGTGKSHTIANLISHFVAEGKRVLVTAEKEQALKVLANKVPEDIRDLTVSVLGADEDGRRRLGDSIRGIQTRVGLIDRRISDERIADLTAAIDRLDRRYAEVTGQLRDSRWAEFEQLPGRWLAGETPTPQMAAGWVHDHPELAGIPDPVSPGTPCPLTVSEFGELLASLRTVERRDAQEAVLVLPPISELPSTGALVELFEDRLALTAAAERARQLIRTPPPVGPDLADRARTLAADLQQEAQWRDSIDGTWLARVVTQSADPRLDAEWADLTTALAELRGQIFDLRKRVRAHDVQLPPTPGPEFEKHLTEAAARLKAKGKLGLFDRDGKAAVEACRVDGRAPATADTVQLCLDALTVETLRHRLAIRWRNQTADVGAPPLTGLPEEAVGAHLDTLAEVRRTASRWADLTDRAAALGLPPLRTEPRALAGMAAVACDLAALARRADIDRELGELRERLTRGATGPRAAPGWSVLADAVTDRDAGAWDGAIARVRVLTDLAPRVTRQTELRERLAAVAPGWTASLVRDPEIVREVDDLEGLWQWRQLDTWVRTVSARSSPAVLQAQLEETSAERRRTVTELVTEKAWRRLVDNLGHPQRQALEEYVQASKRFGKTGGKHASRWIAEMRRAMGNATTAVPVWIMPTARALLNFRPAATPPFDVLIIDEASQIGMGALPLLALARAAIVVGDDQQTSPENVGLDRDPVFSLMDDHLREIPGYRTVFDPDKSLYDLALLRFSQPIMLTEHFRCLPQIIDFSNQLSYNGRIVPLRDRPPHPGWRPLRTVKVPDGYRSGFVNRPEAEAVVALLRDLDGRPEYDGMTFGVISLLNTQQSKLIRDLVYDQLGPALAERRRIRVGEAASFQGDERDVMVISTVVAVDPSKENTRFGAMTSEADKRRMNVAASRARHQLWVVTSVDPSVLSPGDFRARLLVHCSETAVGDEERGDLLDRCESEFERRVVRTLLARGYVDVAVQHRVGQYRLDIVVSGPDARLAIECDGDRWHSETEWDRDRARQQVLERAGWTFERIRGSAFFRDPDVAMEPVWERLEALGIPVGPWPALSVPAGGAEPAVDRPPPPGIADPSAGADAAAHRADQIGAVVDVPASEVGLDELPRERSTRAPSPTVRNEEAVPDDPPRSDTTADSDSRGAGVGDDPTEWAPPARYRSPSDRADDDLQVADAHDQVRPAAPIETGPPSWYRSPIEPEAGPPETPAPADSRPPAWYVALSSDNGTAERGTADPPVVGDPPRGPDRLSVGDGLLPASGHPATGIAKAPYREWVGGGLPAVDVSHLAAIADGIVDIVRAEGPVHVDRVYHLYVRATGGRRVGHEIRRVLDMATDRAISRHLLDRVSDRHAQTGSATLHVAGSPAVVLRERGPRDLFDIPRGEVRALMSTLGNDAAPAQLKRAVLREWGFGRLTEKADTYLDECRSYSMR